MSDLYPTPALLAFLQKVAAGLVWHNDRDGQAYVGSGRVGDRPKATAAVDRAVAVGWIEKRSPTSGVYRLTAAGRAFLDAHGGERNG